MLKKIRETISNEIVAIIAIVCLSLLSIVGIWLNSADNPISKPKKIWATVVYIGPLKSAQIHKSCSTLGPKLSPRTITVKLPEGEEILIRIPKGLTVLQGDIISLYQCEYRGNRIGYRFFSLSTRDKT